jgi:next-to-BRCA1 protein 1
MEIDGVAMMGSHQHSPAQDLDDFANFWSKDQLTPPQLLDGAQHLPHWPQQPQDTRAMSRSSSCCSVSQGKEEIRTLLTTFKSDLERIMSDKFGPSSGNLTSPHPNNSPTTVQTVPGVWHETLPSWETGAGNIAPMPGVTPTARRCVNMWCMVCGTLFGGPWYSCDKCSWHVLVRCSSQILTETKLTWFNIVVPQLCGWPWSSAWILFRRRTHYEQAHLFGLPT